MSRVIARAPRSSPSMSAHEPSLTLRQIVELCDKALALRAETTWEEFRADWRRQMLGERLVEVIGEAVKRLPEDLRARHPQEPRALPWAGLGWAFGPQAHAGRKLHDTP